MENLLLILVIVLLVGLLGTIGALAWLGHRYLRLQELERTKAHPSESEKPQDSLTPEVLPLRKHPNFNRGPADILKAIRSQQGRGLYCVDHPDLIAIGHCAISGESLCEHCLTSQKEVKLAKKYLDLYLDSEWVEVLMLPNKEVSQDAAERIVKVKSSLWEDQARPMIVQGHYKINVESDEIEAFTVVIARKDDSDFIKKELSFIQ